MEAKGRRAKNGMNIRESMVRVKLRSWAQGTVGGTVSLSWDVSLRVYKAYIGFLVRLLLHFIFLLYGFFGYGARTDFFNVF